ncbi:MAG TPA: S9 family peptidase [Verrucomicrobiae bacterium]
MSTRCLALGLALLTASPLLAAPFADNLVVQGVPQITAELQKEVGRYLEFRGAGMADWHPTKREMLIATRFADTPQLHYVKFPGGNRKQMTFLSEPIGGGSFKPKTGEFIVFAQDKGGNEFYQFYRFDLKDGRITLLTDGASRNTGAKWSTSGKEIAYTSTRRTGRDNDLYLINPANPKSDRKLIDLKGGGWGVADWSPDDQSILLAEYVSINESYLHKLDIATGKIELLTPKGATKIAYGGAKFTKDGKCLIVTTDQDSEFQRLGRFDLVTKAFTPYTSHIKWDVDEFELSKDGNTIALVTNEDGAGILRLMDAKTGKEHKTPKLPIGTVSSLNWHENNRDLAFNLSSSKAPFDVYSLDVKDGKVERWTESETGGLDSSTFSEPEMIRVKSFDGLEVSGFIYRPDAKKFPGPHPVIVSIHGGPESQSRPRFQARLNYYLNEMGIALLYPNVRGSAGYGKTFLTLDNGFKREDSVKDIGAFLDWIDRDGKLDKQRIAVMGGSYGGYMTLACMVHYNDRIRCGNDIVGISNFVTFLNNTQDYRRDLRRVEYGDERDPKMREHLEKISPNRNADKIKKPLFVVQGQQDPRVPYTEAEQMVEAIRKNGGKVWYMMATDEGHGFGKKKNADTQFLATIMFLQENLLK